MKECDDSESSDFEIEATQPTQSEEEFDFLGGIEEEEEASNDDNELTIISDTEFARGTQRNSDIVSFATFKIKYQYFVNRFFNFLRD